MFLPVQVVDVRRYLHVSLLLQKNQAIKNLQVTIIVFAADVCIDLYFF